MSESKSLDRYFSKPIHYVSPRVYWYGGKGRGWVFTFRDSDRKTKKVKRYRKEDAENVRQTFLTKVVPYSMPQIGQRAARKLTAEDVLFIRRNKIRCTRKELAKKFQVSLNTISSVTTGKFVYKDTYSTLNASIWSDGKRTVVQFIVDKEDYKKLVKRQWRVYSRGVINHSTAIYLTSYIFPYPVRRISGDKLDYRKHNFTRFFSTRERPLQAIKYGSGTLVQKEVGHVIYSFWFPLGSTESSIRHVRNKLAKMPPEQVDAYYVKWIKKRNLKRIVSHGVFDKHRQVDYETLSQINHKYPTS